MLDRRGEAIITIAYEAAERAGLGPRARDIAVAQWWAESRCGMLPPFLLPDGRPSFNMGACTAKAGVPSFGGSDKDKDGNTIAQRWAKFSNPDQGVAYWLSFGSVKAARKALEAGDVEEFSRILYRGGYYTAIEGSDEDRIRAYVGMVKGAMREIAETRAKSTYGTGRAIVALGTAVVPVAFWAWREFMR